MSVQSPPLVTREGEQHYMNLAARAEEKLQAIDGVADACYEPDSIGPEEFAAVEKAVFQETRLLGGATFAELLQQREQHEDLREPQDAVETTVGSLVWGFMREEKVAKARRMLGSGLGLFVIRPEVSHVSREIQDFVSEHGVRIVEVQQTVISGAEYAALYSHAFRWDDPAREGHVRRRAFGYVDTPLEVVLMQDETGAGHEFMDDFTERVKGVAGVHDGETLRGGVVHETISTMRAHDPDLTDQALDPLGMFRSASLAGTYKPGVDPYLANIPGVHIPDSNEAIKDYCVLVR